MPEQDKPEQLHIPLVDAQQAVEWYRALGQEEAPVGQKDKMVAYARHIGERYRTGFYVHQGQTFRDLPYLLDAANMLIDAARLEGDQTNRDDLRREAGDMLIELFSDEKQESSVQIVAMTYFSDLIFQAEYDKLVAEQIEPAKFKKAWLKAFKSSALAFLAAESGLRESGREAHHGNLLEWFVLMAERRQQLIDNRMGEEFIRSSLLREDRAPDFIDALSGNFDIAYDSMVDGAWRTQGFLQVTENGLHSKRTRYKEHIVVHSYNFEVSHQESQAIMRRAVQAMAARAEAELNPDKPMSDQDIKAEEQGLLLAGSFN